MRRRAAADLYQYRYSPGLGGDETHRFAVVCGHQTRVSTKLGDLLCSECEG